MRTCLVVCWAALTLSILGCEEEPVGPQPATPLRPFGAPPAQGPSRGPPPPPAPSQEPQRPRPPAPSQEPQRPRNPWSQARVGDVLEYDYSHTSEGGLEDGEATLRATLTLEVVAIDSPWVWVKVTVKRKEPDSLERSFLIPVDREQQPTPNPAAQRSPGKPSKASVGESSLACEEGHVDGSASDGPVSSWCDSEDPLMYLGRRIWQKSTVAGPHSHSASTLQATRVLRGAEAAAPALPTGIPRLFAPALWYRRLPVSARAGADGGEFQELFVGGWGVRKWRSLSRVQRTAEDLKRTDLVKVAEAWFTPSAWQEEPTQTLLDTVLAIVQLDARWSKLAERARGGSIQLAAGEIESWIASSGQEERREYAKDPWAPLFDGLPWEARSEPLIELQGRKGQEEGKKLWDWSAAPLAPSPAKEGDPPDTLSQKEILETVYAMVRKSACVRPLNEARKKRHEASSYPLQLTLQIKPDGSVPNVSLSDPKQSKKKKKGGLPPKVLRCLQTDFRKLRFPRHGQQLPPFVTDLGV